MKERLAAPQSLKRLIGAAILVAASAPEKRSRYTNEAKVWWPYISELRAALEASGFDWKTVAAHERARELQRIEDRLERNRRERATRGEDGAAH